ncbi:MAG: lytic transglycosylase domain-containing protein, partial [Candidatus Baltobacteraceae bacterium]
TGARSWVGAIGLGQLMPGTAAQLHVDPHDPYQNLQGAAKYLGGLIHRYRNSPHQYSLAFAAYNAGPKAIAHYGGIPPYA